jgi:hypothetical protein
MALTVQDLVTNAHTEGSSILRSWVNKDTKIWNLKQTLEDQIEDNYVNLCILIRMTRVNHDQREVDARGGYPNKKQKKHNYNRMFLFADTGTTNTVFAIFCETDKQSRTATHYAGDIIGIGQPFIIIAPKYKEQCWKIDCPVLQTSLPWIPLKISIMSRIPEILPHPPAEINEATCFLIHNKTVIFKSIELRGKGDMEPPSCSSFLCDRKEPLKVNKCCCCFNRPVMGNLSPVVMESTVIVGHNDSIIVHYHRSYRTTLLFINNPETIGMLQPEDRIIQFRAYGFCVQKCYTYINSNGGFTIGGYIQRGESVDQSDTTEKIASLRPTFHLTYIMPTDIHIRERPEYKVLKYNYVPCVAESGTVINSGTAPAVTTPAAITVAANTTSIHNTDNTIGNGN